MIKVCLFLYNNEYSNTEHGGYEETEVVLWKIKRKSKKKIIWLNYYL